MRMYMWNVVTALVVIMLLICGACSDTEQLIPINPETDIQSPPGDAEPLTSPATVGRWTIDIQTHVWRDHMPDPPENPDSAQNSTGLRVSITAVASDSSNLQANFNMNYVWVYQGDLVFESLLDGESEPVDSFAIKKTVAGGPFLEVGSLTDVVVRLVDTETFEPVSFRVYNVPVVRTD